MDAPLTDSRRSFVGANTILAGYENYVARFRVITSRAEVRFLQRDWHGMQADASERLGLYRDVVDEVLADIEALLGERTEDQSIWAPSKRCFLH